MKKTQNETKVIGERGEIVQDKVKKYIARCRPHLLSLSNKLIDDNERQTILGIRTSIATNKFKTAKDFKTFADHDFSGELYKLNQITRSAQIKRLIEKADNNLFIAAKYARGLVPGSGVKGKQLLNPEKWVDNIEIDFTAFKAEAQTK